MKISKGISILICCAVAILSGCSALGVRKELSFREDILGSGTGQLYQVRIYNK